MIRRSVHDILTEFPHWKGAKIVVALSQARRAARSQADLPAKRGDLNAVRGLRLTAADGRTCAQQMLIGAGIDPSHDLKLSNCPCKSRNVSFGVFAARALEAGQIDGFWANAWAVNGGDPRCGKFDRRASRDDPMKCAIFTFAGMATTDASSRAS